MRKTHCFTPEQIMNIESKTVTLANTFLENCPRISSELKAEFESIPIKKFKELQEIYHLYLISTRIQEFSKTKTRIGLDESNIIDLYRILLPIENFAKKKMNAKIAFLFSGLALLSGVGVMISEGCMDFGPISQLGEACKSVGIEVISNSVSNGWLIFLAATSLTVATCSYLTHYIMTLKPDITTDDLHWANIISKELSNSQAPLQHSS